MSAGLRALYERYRTASNGALSLEKRKPGEWLRIGPDTSELKWLSEGVQASPEDWDAMEAALKRLAGASMGPVIGADAGDQEIRVTHARNGRKKELAVKFFLARPGKKSGRSNRLQLPPAFAEQTELFAQEVDSAFELKVGVRRTENEPTVENDPDGRLLANSHVSDDQPENLAQVRDLSHLLDPDSFVAYLESPEFEDDLDVREALAAAHGDVEALERIFEERGEPLPDDDGIDPEALIRAMGESLVLKQAAPPIVDLADPEPSDWVTTSQRVVAKTLGLAAEYREKQGKIAILKPSPGTGKTRAMMGAAVAEQLAGRRVGYAVLSRAQIPETKERLERTSDLIRLHVIEGRHPGNCPEYESVQTAAMMGYMPGTHVCPDCDLYPNKSDVYSSLDASGGGVCQYYASRIRAMRDVDMAARYGAFNRSFPMILTTHASMTIGTSLAEARVARAEQREEDIRKGKVKERKSSKTSKKKTIWDLQDIWNFDTVFIDEDPSSAIEQVRTIKEHQLVYSWKDKETGKSDAHTQFTKMLKTALDIARNERRGEWRNAFQNSKIHTRDHGSTYAGDDLTRLLERAAAQLRLDLLTILASVVNESETKAPGRGKLLGMRQERVASEYPHRHLQVIGKAIYDDIDMETNANDRGIASLNLAYRVHLSLQQRGTDDDLDEQVAYDGHAGEEGITTGAISLMVTTPFKARKANVFIGDAYADVPYYEYLFQRFRTYGDVDIVNDRAYWERSSALIRIPTRCGTGEFKNQTQFLDHCDQAIFPILHMERGRRVLLYSRKKWRHSLEEWTQSDSVKELGVQEFATEHWGSGRGKDIWRDFDTFIAVTEHIPNVYGLVHEANARARGDNGTRIVFWNSGKPGGTSFTSALTDAHPALASGFQRRAVDELAQAVHRIRPAMWRECPECKTFASPAADFCATCQVRLPFQQQKRCWVLGYHVPLSRELLAATSATLVKDRDVTRDGDHGPLLNIGASLGLMSFVSAHEAATFMAHVYQSLGCWSPIFAHLLTGVPVSDCMSQVLYDAVRLKSDEPCEPISRSSVGSDVLMSWSDYQSGRMLDRVYSPPRSWRDIENRVVNTTMYRQAQDMFVESLQSALKRPVARANVRRPWMATQSHGALCIGDVQRLERVIDYYSPNPPSIPF